MTEPLQQHEPSEASLAEDHPARSGDGQARMAATAPMRNSRKVREGIVVSNSMDKTVIVASTDRVRHRRYGKTVQRTTRLVVHDECNALGLGDRVRVAETRPLSKTKRWRLVKVLEQAR